MDQYLKNDQSELIKYFRRRRKGNDKERCKAMENVGIKDDLSVSPNKFSSSSSGDICPTEKSHALKENTRTLVVTNEESNKYGDMNTSRSSKEAGPVESPSVELQMKQVDSTAKASCTPLRKKVPLIAELLNENGEERSEQLVSNNAMPKEVAPPATTSGQWKRKITQKPSIAIKHPGREAKKGRKYKGDTKTTIATIHISDSESEDEGTSAGTGFRSLMPLKQTGNGPCLSKFISHMSVPRGSYDDDIGLHLSLNSYMEVDKIRTPVPHKKTLLSNVLLGKERNCIGRSSAPVLSFSEDVAKDIDGKKLDLSLGCYNKKTNEPQTVSEVSSKKTDQSSLPTHTQVDTYNRAHDGLQPCGMAVENRACGASCPEHLKPKFPKKMESQTIYLPTCLPSLTFHKGKTIQDFDLNRADPNDLDLGKLLPFPFVANNTGRDSNRQELVSLHSYSNEAIPAMQLLTLMDVGTQSGDPLSVDGIKFTEKPFFPYNNHCDLSMDQRTNLFEKPLFPQNHQVEEYSSSETTIYKSSASTRRMPSALIGQDIVKSQQAEKAKKAYLPQQNKDWRSRTSGVPDMIGDCNPRQEKEKAISSVSAEVVFPIQGNTLKFVENQINVSSCHKHGTNMRWKDMSKHEVCVVSRNPADFSISEAGNIYMIGSGDLKFRKDFSSRYRGFDGQRRP